MIWDLGAIKSFLGSRGCQFWPDDRTWHGISVERQVDP